jgi:4'-phosphopantetheinyl transferase EntD
MPSWGHMQETFNIASLVPPAAAAAEIFGPCADAALLPQEEFALGQVSDDRKREFTLGRECARRALKTLGIGPVPILRGPAREPLWPPGICGSITHCDGYCAAVAAHTADIRGIGIDAERVTDFGDAVMEQIAFETERVWIKQADGRIPWGVLLFSAKESVFKAWFQVVGTWLGFEHAQIEFHPARQAFRARVTGHAPGTPDATGLVGRFRFDGKGVQTSAYIPVRK